MEQLLVSGLKDRLTELQGLHEDQTPNLVFLYEEFLNLLLECKVSLDLEKLYEEAKTSHDKVVHTSTRDALLTACAGVNDIDGPPPFDVTLFEKVLQHWKSFQNGEHDMESTVKKALQETMEHCIATMVATCKDAMEEAQLNEILALVDGMHSVSEASACVCVGTV